MSHPVSPDPGPRRVSPAVRYLVAAAGFTLPLLLLVAVVAADLGEDAATVASALVFVCWLPALLVLLNHGFRPRRQGSRLDVTTVLGRQSLDLSALTRIRYERGRNGRDSLRLRDSSNEFAIGLPRDPELRADLARAVREAGHRGVVVPQQVGTALGVPATAGAPRYGSGVLGPPVVATLLAAVMLGCLVTLVIVIRTWPGT